MRRPALAALVFVLLATLPARAQLHPYIVNGLPTAQYPTVGALLDGNDFDAASLICSGTLIGCQTFLTAGHCVEGDLNPQHYSVFLQHAGFFAVTAVALHPTYHFPVGDVAVLTLATPVTGISPTPIDTTAVPPFGAAATIAGFGRTGGFAFDYGIKRAGAVSTASCTTGISNTTSVCWNFLAPLGPPGTDSSTCNGDSGGPLFVDFGGGNVVAGVTSGGNNADCLPDDVSFDANVFFYRSFIQSIAGADLGNTTCGSLPQVGAPDGAVQSFAGTVTTATPEGRHSFTVGPGVGLVRVAMNALDDGVADFDLYVKFGSPPTTTDYDCRRNGPGQYAFCEFPAPATGTWHVLVSRWAGAGAYQATVTTFGLDCSNPVNDGLPCDDRNACTTVDHCQAGTCVGTPLTNGTPCDDGNGCTGPDSCQAGACSGASAPDDTPCDDGHICTRGDACHAGACVPGPSPALACKRPFLPGKGILMLKRDPTASTRDRLTWRWASGSATDKSEFGNPVTGTTFGLCLYDDDGSGPTLVLERTVPAGADWVETADGFRYNDRTLANAGLRSIALRANPSDGRASIQVRGQGSGLGMIALPLHQQPQVRMQLVNENGCWEALYDTNLLNLSSQFKAKAD